MVTSDDTLRREAQLAEAARVYKTKPEYSSIRKTAACFDLVKSTTLLDRINKGRSKIRDIEHRQHLSGTLSGLYLC
jgi:hypothetical protein